MQSNPGGRVKILTLAAVLTVLGAAVSAMLQIERILLRWEVILLLVVFVGLQVNLPEISENRSDRRKSSWMMALQVLIVAGLVLLTGIGFSFFILFFILSVNAAQTNSLRGVLGWVAGLILVTAFLNVRGGGWERLLLETAVYAAGYLFLGVTTNALRTARLAQAQQMILLAQQEKLLAQQQNLLGELERKNQQLQEYASRVETLAVEEERNRLSREMHDTLGHHLTSSAVQLEAAQRLLPEQSERAAAMLGEVRQEVRQALVEVRQFVGRLRQPAESELDLMQSVKRMARRFQDASGLKLRLELPQEECPILPAQRLALYRAVQEGLTNIQKHAQATEVTLRMTCDAEAIRLELQDNGCGLPEGGLEAEQVKGFGLRGMVERAAALGGEVRLENVNEGGVRLTVWLPKPVPGQEDS